MQTEYIACVFFCGWLMGIVFDFYNTVTGVSKWLRWLRPLLDISFWCLSAVFVYYLTFVTDSGRFRVYTFGLLVVGYLIYRVLLHHFVVGSAFAVVRFVGGICRLVWKLVDFLILTPVRVVVRLIAGMVRLLYWVLCRVEDVAAWVVRLALTIGFFPLQPLWQAVQPLRSRIVKHWEGMCDHASKWLKRKQQLD